MSIRKATTTDVPQMVDLSEQKRVQYQAFQPLFWRKAEDSRQRQLPFLERQVVDDNVVALVHEDAGGIDGFIIANLRSGHECAVDDFALAAESEWQAIGAALLREAGSAAKVRGINRYDVVCGHLDQPKRAMLNNFGLTLERYWYTAAIDGPGDVDSRYQVRAATPVDALQMATVAGQPQRKYPNLA